WRTLFARFCAPSPTRGTRWPAWRTTSESRGGEGPSGTSSGRPLFRFGRHSPGTPLDRVLIAVIVSALALPTGECQAATGSPAPATTDYRSPPNDLFTP
ncbi:LOW QUALITY PROTEIN: conserved hypothetical protein, partial [Streptomyces sp. SPB78]